MGHVAALAPPRLASSVNRLAHRLHATAQLLHRNLHRPRHLYHLVAGQVEEELDEIAVDEAIRFDSFAFVGERAPSAPRTALLD